MQDVEPDKAMLELAETLCIDAGHPSLPGHFPGQPVVPGVVLLDHVAACIGHHRTGRLRRLGAVKFLAPLLPGETARLHVVLEGRRARFRILRDEVPIASGEGEWT